MSEVVYGPPFVIDGPVPEPPPYRLIDVVPEFDIRGDNRHWQNGVQVYPYPPDLPEGTTPCLEGTFRTKGEGEGWDLPIFGPFALYVADTCSTITIGRDPQAFADRARVVMDAVKSYGIERQLVAGASQPDNPFIGDSNAVLPFASAGLDPRQALSALEEAIGSTGKQGLIHATPGTVAAWDSTGAEIVERDGKLFTRRGTPVVVGTGYIGTRPTAGAGAGDHQAWAYASGPVEWRGSEIFMTPDNVREALDRENNVITYRAEEQFVVEWDTALQVAVLVSWS